MASGAVIVDIRSDSRRASEGEIPGSWIVPRNVFEWRFADDEGARDPRLPDRDGLPVVICDQGYQSSLVAHALQQLGFARATDVIGGFAAWVRRPGCPSRRAGTAARLARSRAARTTRFREPTPERRRRLPRAAAA